MRYEPTERPIKHGTLYPENWYHEERLVQLGVPFEHMHSEEHKKTLATVHQEEANAVAAAEEANEQPFAQSYSVVGCAEVRGV